MSLTELNSQASFEALSDIALIVNTIHDPAELLTRSLEIAMQVLDAERGFLLLLPGNGADTFEVRAFRNLSESELGEMVRISETVVREVLREGEPILMFEAQKDERFGATESIVIEKIESIACVPLSRRSDRIGAIYLDSVTKRGKFTPQNLPFLKAVANQVAVALENAEMLQRLRDENRHLRSEMQRLHGFDEIIGSSPRMQDVFDTMSRVLDTDATILISGESGTGKELVARAIHYNGTRKDDPFVAVFCGSLPDSLLESELFGHKRGAFTGAAVDKKGLFEVADGGTIFLDEVSELSPRMQMSLLRVLQEGEIKRVGDTAIMNVDVRVVSASNKNLQELISEGEFREDLYYRLNTIEITLPPLRHRRSDIPLLANHFLDRYARGNRAHIRGFDSEALSVMRGHAWPGNVRELENAVERAVVLSRGDVIGPEDLRIPEGAGAAEIESGMTMKELERRYVTRTLEDLQGNISETARTLGVSRRWLHYRLKEWQAEEE